MEGGIHLGADDPGRHATMAGDQSRNQTKVGARSHEVVFGVWLIGMEEARRRWLALGDVRLLCEQMNQEVRHKLDKGTVPRWPTRRRVQSSQLMSLGSFISEVLHT
jgi:hypothetical protein